jgi:hypothetical protein
VTVCAQLGKLNGGAGVLMSGLDYEVRVWCAVLSF